ncbi:MAG: PEP-CTERM sorting domain-containing protein [Rhodopila sp.]
MVALVLAAGQHALAVPTLTSGSTDAFAGVWLGRGAAVPLSLTPEAGADHTARLYFASIVPVPAGANNALYFMPRTEGGGIAQAKRAGGADSLALETISTINQPIVLEHTKPGNLAARSQPWTNAGGTSVYVATTRGFVVQGSFPAAGQGTAPGFGYGFSPAPATKAESDGGVYDMADAVFILGTARPSQRAAGGATGLSRSVQAPSKNDHSGPALSGASVGTMQSPASYALDVAVGSLAAELNNGGLNRRIEAYAITEADPTPVRTASLPADRAGFASGTLILPLTVVGMGPGDLTSNLTIFTSDGANIGNAGTMFNYLLNPMVVAGMSMAAPEPASLAVLGAGLAALACVHRRRHGSGATHKTLSWFA